MNIPRPEHPKPQFARAEWLNLNGTWQFERDDSRSGVARGLYREDVSLVGTINVPFCPESRLSGVEDKDFYYGLCYKREFSLPAEWNGGRVLIHFGAVDYRCEVYINDTSVGKHRGGYVSFAFDITDALRHGNNRLTVFAQDGTRAPLIPRGKQSEEFSSHGCDYTRTSGIWQTVWLEYLPEEHICSARYTTDVENAVLNITVHLQGSGHFVAKAYYAGKPMGEVTADSRGGVLQLSMPLAEKHPWEPGHGRLYTLELFYGNDRVKSYFGLRSISLTDGKFLINGKSIFQRLVLDQGFYPDGIYTAPCDAELRADIERSMACGFNGARLHEKVFEERFLYYCDQLGYLAWAEYPNWGLDISDPRVLHSVLPEWLEEIERDYNHPAIIGWCPFNETWDYDGRKQYDETIRAVYRATKSADPTRPCIDTSGAYHVESDIYDIHDYEQDPAVLVHHYDQLNETGIFKDWFDNRQQHRGEPFFVSECGGIRWSVVSTDDAWGYGNAPKTQEEFIERFRGLMNVFLDQKHSFGLCYTQLTDVEQEQNGLYTYDRKPKFDPAVFREILSRKAAIEEE